MKVVMVQKITSMQQHGYAHCHLSHWWAIVVCRKRARLLLTAWNSKCIPRAMSVELGLCRSIAYSATDLGEPVHACVHVLLCELRAPSTHSCRQQQQHQRQRRQQGKNVVVTPATANDQSQQCT
jgi:hypothetical protein